MSNAVWVHKGMYGNGTVLAPFMDLYECSNCKALSVEQFDVCPECYLNMMREGEGDDGNGRLSGTSRGVFTVEQLEATDLFVCVGDEKQTIYMAVTDPNNEPKYKTKKPVVNIETGEIHYFDNNTKVYVYRPGCELRVGEFIWSSEGYN